MFYNYDQYGSLLSVELDGNVYFYIKDALGIIQKLVDESGNVVVSYTYDAWGKVTINNSPITDIGTYNPFMYKDYYYDKELGMYNINNRFYLPDINRFLIPADVSSLNPSSINGLNLYSYANNNPIGIAYSSSSVSGTASRGMGNSFSSNSLFTKNVSSISTSKGGLNLEWLANGLDTGSTIHGLYTSISGLVNHTVYFAKNLIPFSDDMKMLGASMKDGVLAFNQFSWGLGKSDIFGIALGVGLDIYDSIQRGVSPGGVVLGATLTAAKGVGLIYLNKGILYGATALGSAICPGVGTVVGFVVGGVVCIVVDIFVSNWLDDLIDKIAN